MGWVLEIEQILISLRTQLYWTPEDAVVSAATSPPVEMHPQVCSAHPGSSVTGQVPLGCRVWWKHWHLLSEFRTLPVVYLLPNQDEKEISKLSHKLIFSGRNFKILEILSSFCRSLSLQFIKEWPLCCLENINVSRTIWVCGVMHTSECTYLQVYWPCRPAAMPEVGIFFHGFSISSVAGIWLTWHWPVD